MKSNCLRAVLRPNQAQTLAAEAGNLLQYSFSDLFGRVRTQQRRDESGLWLGAGSGVKAHVFRNRLLAPRHWHTR